MRYFCSRMGRTGCWRETDATSEVAFIKVYVDKHMRIYDADNDGEETVFFAFSTGTYFRVSYQWSIVYDPEWELRDDVSIDEIPGSEAVGISEDRDWMNISKYSTIKNEPGWQALVERMNQMTGPR